MKLCLTCDKRLKKSSIKYCSNACQQTYQYKGYINNWKLGLENGSRGIVTRNISSYIRRYLIEKYGEKCYLCNWDKINPVTKKVPLEIDHNDGNADDNCEENLRLICPNCHSLSTNFRNLNKGKGRTWRKLKYLKNKKAGFA